VLATLQIRRACPDATIALVEAGPRAARGLAYGTPYGAHLLNVPARNMSAFPDDADHFVRWLSTRLPGSDGQTYAPRPLYGEYLADLLQREAGAGTTRVHGAAVGLTKREDGWVVHLQQGAELHVGTVVLALGNLAPGDLAVLSSLHDDRYIRDPWAGGAVEGLAKDASVLLIGTGLTMVDLVLALRAEGHRAPIVALSRHGLLPREHAPYPAQKLEEAPDLAGPAAAWRWFRCRLADAGPEWRGIVDSLRPHTSTIWKRWTPRQRRSFLRHARFLWEVHRHRVAPGVASQVRALVDSGELRVHRGKIVGVESKPERLLVRWRSRGGSAEESLAVNYLVNCTGPNSNYATIDVPLVAQMRRAGYLVPDALRLGIETADNGALLGRDGEALPGLFTLGPLRRPELWETTAIPEIRAQAAALAALIRG